MLEHLSTLAEIAVGLREKGHELKWYVFGSILVRPATASDLDILVIHVDLASPVAVRNALSSANIPASIDLLLLEKDEEVELRFLENQLHRQFFPA